MAGSLVGYLEGGDVRRLQALGALGDFEFHCLSFVQRLVAFRLNRRKMDEHILAVLALDESESLAGVKPLYRSLFSQCVSLLFFKLFGCSSHGPQPTNKKGCKCGLAALKHF